MPDGFQPHQLPPPQSIEYHMGGPRRAVALTFDASQRLSASSQILVSGGCEAALTPGADSKRARTRGSLGSEAVT